MMNPGAYNGTRQLKIGKRTISETSLLIEDIVRFLILIGGTIVFIYFTPPVIGYLWQVLILVLYFKSKDEAFWLVYFLIITDGFASFFGLYNVVLPVLPGLPSIELSQFYIIIAFYKAASLHNGYSVFYRKQIEILMVYLLFLIAWGIINGLSGGINVYFRVVKLTLPFLLFYSIPKLFQRWSDYKRIFMFLFPVAIIATVTQLIDINLGITPSGLLSIVTSEAAQEIADEEVYRGFFNPGAILITLFGSLFFLSSRVKSFNKWYLYSVIASSLTMAFLSATRGWIIGFALVILMYILVVEKINVLRVMGFGIMVTIMALVVSRSPGIKEQVNNSKERLYTLANLRGGDITAGGTVKRLDVRSPRVMKKWSENPVLGWGFSDETFIYQDPHVGNQSILLQAGVIGAMMLLIFFGHFNLKLVGQSMISKRYDPFKKGLLVFPIFFSGWFIIHTTSGQHFSFGILPGTAIVQALFFSMGAFIYRESSRISGSFINQPLIR